MPVMALPMPTATGFALTKETRLVHAPLSIVDSFSSCCILAALAIRAAVSFAFEASIPLFTRISSYLAAMTSRVVPFSIWSCKILCVMLSRTC